MSSKSILIVDRSQVSGYRLRNSLLENDAIAHVFNAYAPALVLLGRKKIDTAVVEFAADKETVDFCNVVRAMHIPLVFASASEQGEMSLYGFVAGLQQMASRSGNDPIRADVKISG